MSSLENPVRLIDPLELGEHRGRCSHDRPRHDLATLLIQDTKGRLPQVGIQTDVPLLAEDYNTKI